MAGDSRFRVLYDLTLRLHVSVVFCRGLEKQAFCDVYISRLRPWCGPQCQGGEGGHGYRVAGL